MGGSLVDSLWIEHQTRPARFMNRFLAMTHDADYV